MKCSDYDLLLVGSLDSGGVLLLLTGTLGNKGAGEENKNP